MVNETANAIYALIRELRSQNNKRGKVRSMLINTAYETETINEKLATLDNYEIIDIKVAEIVGGQGLLVLYRK